MTDQGRNKPVFETIDLHRHGVIEASAGTGKTYTIENLVLRLLKEQNLKIEEILVVTFTEKAAGELKERIRLQLDTAVKNENDSARRSSLEDNLNNFDRAAISTIHGFCNRIINEFPFACGSSFETELADQETVLDRQLKTQMRGPWKQRFGDGLENLIRDCLVKLNLNLVKSDMVLELTRKYSPEFGDRLISGSEAGETAAKLFIEQIVKDLHKESRRDMREQGLISYNEMVLRVWESLSNPASDLCGHLRKRYRYGIIDEFQDTNPGQWLIFKEIFLKSRIYGKAENRFLYLVGDPKQAIYAFQGSDVNTYFSACKAVLAADGKTYSLKDNYRSGRKMVDAFNVLFSGEEWFQTEDISHIDAGFGRSDKQKPEWKKTDTPETGKAPVIIGDFSGIKKVGNKRKAAGRWITDHIKKLIREQPFEIPDGQGKFRPLNYGDMGILAQKHSESDEVCKTLSAAGIPFARYKQNGLFQTADALEWFYLLDAVSNPDNTAAVGKALLTPFFGFRPDDLSSRAGTAVRDRILKWNELAIQKRWARLFAVIDDETRVRERLLFLPEPLRRLANLRQLMDYTLKCLEEEGLCFADAVRRLYGLYHKTVTVSDDENHLGTESEKPGVRVMTIYASKGLEFPVVFLMGGGSGTKSSSGYLEIRRKEGGRDFHITTENKEAKEQMNAQKDEELRRLFYVALTRARFKIYIPKFDNVSAPPDSNTKKNVKSASEKFLSWCLNKAADTSPLFQYDRGREAGEQKDPADEKEKPVHCGAENTAEQILTELLKRESPANQTIYQRETNTPVRHPFQTSYSALAHEGGRDSLSIEGRHNRDGAPEQTAVKQTFSLPGGTATGNMLHEIMEHISFTDVYRSPDPRQLPDKIMDVIRNRMRAYNITEFYLMEVQAILWNTLRAELPGPDDGFCLGEITEHRAEMEFHFSFNRNGDLFPRGRTEGYIIGYIDLLFRRNERYYLLDWKSDTLPDYSEMAIQKCMQERHYDIQQALYCIAVHRWLGSIIPGYNPEIHFGGTIYAFMRGIRPGTDKGFSVMHPSRQMLENDFPEKIKELIGNK